jgi:RNA-binding protein with serine-rich domain 1
VIESSTPVTLHVGNLTRNVTSIHLMDVFECFGDCSVELQVDRGVGLSKGFAYVSYSNPRDAETAVLSMDSAQLDGNIIKVTLIRCIGYSSSLTTSPSHVL